MLAASTIRLFTPAVVRAQGRAANDANNAAREEALTLLLNPNVSQQYFTHPEFGQEWRQLSQKWREALETVAIRNSVPNVHTRRLMRTGGRRFNNDWTLTFSFLDGRGLPQERKVPLELKFGGTRISALPEIFSPAADKPFHADQPYADYFWEHYLPRIREVYPECLVYPPYLEAYRATVYQNNYDRHPFYRALYQVESTGSAEQKQAKAALVQESIRSWLELVKDKTDLAAITAEFRRSQTNKEFLIYDGEQFHHDSISQEELTATAVLGVRNGNVLMIQSADPNTRYDMLIRWKNHLGILYPAWQISLKRTRPQAT
jgi:hypothetical protein